MNHMNRQTHAVPQAVYRLGFWAAVLSTLFAVAFNIAAILDRFGIPPEPWDLVPLMAPSFFLAPAFVVLMVCVHRYTPEERRVWSQAGLAFAVVYAVLITIVYFVELSVVLPHLLEGRGEEVSVLIFTGFDSFMYALDVLGYGFMSLATLFAAGAFRRDGGAPRLERAIHGALLANGLLAPIVPTQMFFPVLLFVSALWIVTFPLSTVLLAVLFRRGEQGCS